MYSDQPPQWDMPSSLPVTMTLSPVVKETGSEATITPAASIPGVWGYTLVTPGFPVQDRASL